MFESFISSCNNDARVIQERCEEQRTVRNSHFKQILLGQEFKGVRGDEYLKGFLTQPDYRDPRNNLCVWARPTKAVCDVAAEIQDVLRGMVPGIWTTPRPFLHMTALEIAHTLTAEEISSCAAKLRSCLPTLVAYPILPSHRTNLIRPKLSFDSTAVALSFLPAADNFTYLHLRSALSHICGENGVEVIARYATTSSHITLARFVDGTELKDKETMKKWVEKIEEMNIWLQEKFWDGENPSSHDSTPLQWWIGAERGLEIRKDDLWYGGGVTIEQGEHF